MIFANGSDANRHGRHLAVDCGCDFQESGRGRGRAGSSCLCAECRHLGLTWRQWRQLRHHVHVFQAIFGLVTLHLADGLGTYFGFLALPLTVGLRAHMMTRLLIAFTLQMTIGLTALRLASGTILRWAEALWANNLTLWLPTLHLASVGAELLTSRCAHSLLACRSTDLITLSRLAIPRALGCALWRFRFLARFLHLCAIHLAALAIKLAILALTCGHVGWSIKPSAATLKQNR